MKLCNNNYSLCYRINYSIKNNNKSNNKINLIHFMIIIKMLLLNCFKKIKF